ncbi:MAG: iron-sulfur cluster repair di-iron protein [Clostridia bacterium]|nr:iron-sulfur cluster repair di-iron protein [Clostridia bacterium]
MEINTSTIVSDIVKSNFKTAQLFEKNSINFCCGGGISIAEACKNANIDVNELLSEIEQVMLDSDPDARFVEGLALDELADYIVKRHHSYVRENIPFLQMKIQKLCDSHADDNPDLLEVQNLFNQIAGNLTSHMQKEEMVLFPLIRNLVKQKQAGTGTTQSGAIHGPISVMEREHEAENERFENIRALTADYTPPANSCNTYRVTFDTLEDFEQDFHRHIHLENNILFKKAMALDQELAN